MPLKGGLTVAGGRGDGGFLLAVDERQARILTGHVILLPPVDGGEATAGSRIHCDDFVQHCGDLYARQLLPCTTVQDVRLFQPAFSKKTNN